MSGLENWKSCRHGFSTTSYGEDDYELHERGVRNRMCDDPAVVANGRFPVKQHEDLGVIKDGAELHYTDSEDSPRTQEALETSCGFCKYFESRS